ncbi:hypothetical protein J4Z08_21080 [Citrobacter portucalensis]|uniref:hypothetical protein n=1 Tax=Citrobacter portucalensis TaxID=1639133 RepID=UPI0031403E2D
MITIYKGSIRALILYGVAVVGGGYFAHQVFIQGFDYPIAPYFVYPMFPAVGLFIAMLFTGDASLKEGILGDSMSILLLLMGFALGDAYDERPVVSSSAAAELLQDFVDVILYLLHVCAIVMGSGYIYRLAAVAVRQRVACLIHRL